MYVCIYSCQFLCYPYLEREKFYLLILENFPINSCMLLEMWLTLLDGICEIGEEDQGKKVMTNHYLVVDSSKPHCVRTDQQENIDYNVTSLRNISHLTLAILVTGLISCPHAWASTDVASLQEVGSWIDDLDGIKNGFISVSNVH